MKCNICGKENEINNKFCVGCGHILTSPNYMDSLKNQSVGNKIFLCALAIILFVIYIFVNLNFIVNKHSFINYLFIIILLIFFIKTFYNLSNNKYLKFNARYFIILNIFLEGFYFMSRSAIFCSYQNEHIKEGSSYIWKRKCLYLIVKFGLLLILTILWHFLLIDNSTLANSIIMPIMFELIVLTLLLVPIFMALIDIAIKTHKIRKEKNEKLKSEQIYLRVGLISWIVSSIFLYINYKFVDAFCMDVVVFIIFAVLYNLIRYHCAKKRQKNYKSLKERSKY